MLSFAVLLHQKDKAVSTIIGVQELTQWRSGAPDFHLRRASFLGLVRFAQQCGQDVAGLQVVIVTRAIEVGWHG